MIELQQHELPIKINKIILEELNDRREQLLNQTSIVVSDGDIIFEKYNDRYFMKTRTEHIQNLKFIDDWQSAYYLNCGYDDKFVNGEGVITDKLNFARNKVKYAMANRS